jgi:excisionase family DNA binding protein
MAPCVSHGEIRRGAEAHPEKCAIGNDAGPHILRCKVKQAAEYCDIEAVKIRSWVSEMRIPHYKLWGAVRFKKAEIGRWLEDKKMQPFRLKDCGDVLREVEW